MALLMTLTTPSRLICMLRMPRTSPRNASGMAMSYSGMLGTARTIGVFASQACSMASVGRLTCLTKSSKGLVIIDGSLNQRTSPYLLR